MPAANKPSFLSRSALRIAMVALGATLALFAPAHADADDGLKIPEIGDASIQLKGLYRVLTYASEGTFTDYTNGGPNHEETLVVITFDFYNETMIASRQSVIGKTPEEATYCEVSLTAPIRWTGAYLEVLGDFESTAVAKRMTLKDEGKTYLTNTLRCSVFIPEGQFVVSADEENPGQILIRKKSGGVYTLIKLDAPIDPAPSMQNILIP